MPQALRPSIKAATPARKEERAKLRRLCNVRATDLSEVDDLDDLAEACDLARLREQIGAGRSIVGEWSNF